MSRDEVYEELWEDDWTYEDVAQEFDLDEYATMQFSTMMREQFDGPEDESYEGESFHLPYAAEWAEQYERDIEEQSADSQMRQMIEDFSLGAKESKLREYDL